MRDGKLHAEVRRMVVSPYHRRQGIAAHLMQALIAHAKTYGVPTIFVHTLPTLTAAIKMYKQLGWVEQPERIYIPNRLGPGVVIIQLRLDLFNN